MGLIGNINSLPSLSGREQEIGIINLVYMHFFPFSFLFVFIVGKRIACSAEETWRKAEYFGSMGSVVGHKRT